MSQELQIQINKSPEVPTEEEKKLPPETLQMKINKVNCKIESNFAYFKDLVNKYHDLRTLCEIKEKRCLQLENQLQQKDNEIQKLYGQLFKEGSVNQKQQPQQEAYAQYFTLKKSVLQQPDPSKSKPSSSYIDDQNIIESVYTSSYYPRRRKQDTSAAT
mmetsp:Transcript_1932/g.2773  ORF Transcript_1932/g.2773 Transcript_1932/m.2773 type:complete len:159 (-) Transcript_1932:2682-3158(-)